MTFGIGLATLGNRLATLGGRLATRGNRCAIPRNCRTTFHRSKAGLAEQGRSHLRRELLSCPEIGKRQMFCPNRIDDKSSGPTRMGPTRMKVRVRASVFVP